MQSSTMRGSQLRSAPFQGTRSVRSRVNVVTVEANKKVSKKTKVILLEDIDAIGKKGEIKQVPVGYYRNFLLPRSAASVATESVLSMIRSQKEAEIRAKMEEKAKAQSFANALATIGKFTIKKKVGDRDQIYGSVQVSEIADAIYQQTGQKLAEADFSVPEIKAVGTYECTIRLHPEVNAAFSVVIVKDKSLTVKGTDGKKK